MAKPRVHELAKELDPTGKKVTSKVILAWLKDQGEFVKAASSAVEPPVARRVREHFAAQVQEASADTPADKSAKSSSQAPKPAKAAPKPGATQVGKPGPGGAQDSTPSPVAPKPGAAAPKPGTAAAVPKPTASAPKPGGRAQAAAKRAPQEDAPVSGDVPKAPKPGGGASKPAAPASDAPTPGPRRDAPTPGPCSASGQQPLRHLPGHAPSRWLQWSPSPGRSASRWSPSPGRCPTSGGRSLRRSTLGRPPPQPGHDARSVLHRPSRRPGARRCRWWWPWLAPRWRWPSRRWRRWSSRRRLRWTSRRPRRSWFHPGRLRTWRRCPEGAQVQAGQAPGVRAAERAVDRRSHRPAR